METKKRAIILRGVSGSGKSTKARELVGESGMIHSTDDFFMRDGKYVFNPEKLPLYHDLNFKAFQASLVLGVNPIVVDNTNTRKWEYKKYQDAAAEAGYQVEVISIPHPDPKVAAQRNTHGVPEEVIRRMISRWEA